MSELILNKEVVNYYKSLKGIKYDIDLLKKIGVELNYHDETLYKFISDKKANFSKILNGSRSITKEYIIPLEKIFGVPIAKLTDPDAYNYLINKEDIPYVKGIKYYAYMDNMDLYVYELSKLTDNKTLAIVTNIIPNPSLKLIFSLKII